MAAFEIATKADQALILPPLLMASFLEQSALIPPVHRHFVEGPTLPAEKPAEKVSIRLTMTDGQTFSDSAIIQYFTELVKINDAPRHASALVEWIQRSESFTSTDFQELRKPTDELDAHLTLRSYIVGYSLSLADVIVWGTIRGNRITYAWVKKIANNISRWFNYVEATNPAFSEIVGEITIHDAKKRAAASAAGASYEIDLPDTGAPMVTRFPPEPSGYLHVGHAKAALLNDYFAHKHGGGILLCRFDDTNPSKESMEFEDAILHDLKLMEIIPEKTTHSSDYFQEMYDFALKLIKDGKAFADDSELGKGDKSRKNRLPSKRRELGIEETLAHFAEMKTGSEEGRRWCLRARIAYDSPNGTLRDPVIYRCNLIPHHRTGTQWMIYPTYDFCAPILDAIEGVTVALRTNEYRDRNVQYEWMQDALGLRKVPIWDFSRFNLIRTVLSKRKLTKIVDDGKDWDWDDPRMPNIRGILRRGMLVPALREFILKQGPSRNVLNLEWGALWAMNKKYIDPIASRHTTIIQDQAVYCRVSGVAGPGMAMKPKYAKNLDLGSKKLLFDKVIVLEQADAQTFQKDEEITLMNWGNVYVRNITKDVDGNAITAIDLELHLAGDVKKTKKVTWLAATTTNLVPVDILSFDYLISKDKIEKEDTLEDFLTSVTEFRSLAFADCNVRELPQGAIIQFERKGYFKLDAPYQGDETRMVFFDIPSGKS